MAWQDIFVGQQPGLSEQDRKQLAGQGLLSGALQALVANNSREVTPGAALAGGLLGGIQSAQQGGQQLVKDRFQQAQMQDQQDQMQRRRAIQDLALKHVTTGPDGKPVFDQQGYTAELASLDPQAAMELHQNELRNQLVGLQTQKAQRDLNTAPTREVNSGDDILTQEQGANGQWNTIAKAPRWNPKQMGMGGGGAGGGHFGPGAFQVLQGDNGQFFRLNKITGEATPVQAGDQGIVGSNTFRNQAQQVKNADSITASTAAVDQINNAINVAENLKKSPGIGEGTGILGTVARNIPGSDAYTFGRDLESFKGNLFLQAIQWLRGTGAITEVEGTKATDSITAVDPKMSRKDVEAHLNVAQSVLRQGLERAQKKDSMVRKATGVQPQAQMQQGMTAEDAFAKYGVK